MPNYMMSDLGDDNNLDIVTRQRMRGNEDWIADEARTLIDKVTGLAFIMGVIVGIVLASLLHKFIVHPWGF